MLHFLMLIATGIIIYNVWIDNTAASREKKRHEKWEAEKTAKSHDETAAYWTKIASGDKEAVKAHWDKIKADNKELDEIEETRRMNLSS